MVELSDGRHRGRGECVPYGALWRKPQGVVVAIETCAENRGGARPRGVATGAAPRSGAQRPRLRISGISKRKARAWRLTNSLSLRRGRSSPHSRFRWHAEAMARARKPPRTARCSRSSSRRGRLSRESRPCAAWREGRTNRRRQRGLEYRQSGGESRRCADADYSLWWSSRCRPMPTIGSRPSPGGRGLRRRGVRCASLGALAGKYDAVNIKLDKTGGLTKR